MTRGRGPRRWARRPHLVPRCRPGFPSCHPGFDRQRYTCRTKSGVIGMTDAKEFLEGWFAALYRFDGLILVFHAYFDETGSGENDPLTAVAGFVYDKAGLAAFTDAWEPEVSSLSGHYRSSPCNAGQAPFRSDDWDERRRHKLMDTLARLSADHAQAAFVVATGKEEFDAARENGPGIRNFLDSPYSMCVVSVLSMVSSWAKSTHPGKGVHCWFESGGPGEQTTAALVAGLFNDPETKDFFSAITGRSWIGKECAPVLCSADLLAWEWRQNALKTEEQVKKEEYQLTPRMSRFLIDRMGDQGKQIWPEHLSGDKVTVWSLSQIFSGDQVG